MSITTEFRISSEAFALAYTFETVSDVSIEVERLVTHSREWNMPCIFATGQDLDAVERALRDDPTVDSLQKMGETGDVREYNVVWHEDVQQLIDNIVDQNGIMQEAAAVDGMWDLTLKFVDQEAVEGFQAYFQDRGTAFELQGLYRGVPPKLRAYDLTPKQHEALVTALVHGYFSVPREVQIQDLAGKLGISTNAVSQRLRRATANLVRNTLETTPDDEVRMTE